MAAGNYKLLHVKQFANANEIEWQDELPAQVAIFSALVKASIEEKSQESHLQVQLFLDEVLWAVIRGEFSVPRSIDFLSKTQMPSKDFLQRLFADTVWLVSLTTLDAARERQRLEEFTAQLEQKAILPRELLAAALEGDHVPAAVADKLVLKKKVNQAKTKHRYTFTRYNLLREHTDGFARATFLLDQLVNLQFTPEATEEQIAQTRDRLVDDAVRLTGFAHLCPNRLAGLAIDMYETALEEGNQARAAPLLTLLERLPRARLTEVIAFQLSVTPIQPLIPSSSKAGQQPPPPKAPSNHTQFLAIAALIAMGYVDLDVLWSYLEPSDAALSESHKNLMSKYQEDVERCSKVDLGNESREDRNAFPRAYQAFYQSTHQKLRLASALISLNAWRPATRVLLSLNRLCKPVLNHYVRSALGDLLKWLIEPMLKPNQKRLPQKEKPTLEKTFRGVRCFNFGLDLAEKQGGEDSASAKGSVPMALKPVEKFDELLPQMRQVLDHIEYFMETDMHLLSSLWRVISSALRQREKAGAGGVSEESILLVIYRHLLPAASLVPHNPQLSELMWNVMSQLRVFRRYMVYSCWESMYDGFLLKLICERARSSAKQILKRVVSNADRKDQMSHQAHFHFCKICFSNPIPAMDVMLKDVEIGFNVNMIPPYIECTNRCPEMTADVMGYLLTRTCMKPASSTRPFLNQEDATLSSWLVNLAEFVGRFYKKHPLTDLTGLLQNIAKRINSEVVQPAPSSGLPPAEMKGESLIRVVLENLIEFMGGYTTVADMNADQLNCLAGGPRLRSESISFGKKEDAGRKEKARQRLYEAIADHGLVKVLLYSFSEQRCHYTSAAFSEAHSGGGGLKLLSMLFDGNHACFLKLTEFLVQASTREKYASLIPELEEVFIMLEPALAFLVARHGLAPYGRKEKDSKATPLAITSGSTSGDSAAAPSNGQAAGGASPAGAAATPAASKGESGAAASAASASLAIVPHSENDAEELEKVCERNVREMQEAEKNGLSRQFYITFWRLSLQDIFVPTDGYDKTQKQLEHHLKNNEGQRKQLERDQRGDHTNHRDYKALKKEVTRLTDFQAKLREEMLLQKVNNMQVVHRIGKEKANWFSSPSPQATAAFIQYLLHPRMLTSHADMLFCCHFVRLLISQKTPGFQLLDFYNLWTCMITQCIRCCTEREATIFGVFIKEMMSYIVSLRKSEADYKKEMQDNCVFHRNYYPTNPAPETIEWAAWRDIVKGHAKWEGRIHKALKQGMDAEEWMEKRNVLLLLSQSCEAFPLVTKYAKVTLESVEVLRDREELSDLKTLATSLAVKLKSRKDRWFPDEKPEKTTRHGISNEAAVKRDHATSSTGKKNALGSSPGTQGTTQAKSIADVQATPETAGSKSDRDRDRGSKRTAEQESGAVSEKRTRREVKNSPELQGTPDSIGSKSDRDRDRASKRSSEQDGGIVSEKRIRREDSDVVISDRGSSKHEGESKRESKRPDGEKRADKVDDRLARERQSERHSSGHSGGSRNALATERTSGSHHYRQGDYSEPRADPRADPRSRTSASYPHTGGSSSRGYNEPHRSRR